MIGRCSFGGVIDRELNDMRPVDARMPDDHVPLDQDLGKDFLYVRYNADLPKAGLAELGLGDLGIVPEQVQKRAVDNLEELQKIGAALGKRVDLAQLGSFVGE
jgi:hypothetical protein